MLSDLLANRLRPRTWLRDILRPGERSPERRIAAGQQHDRRGAHRRRPAIRPVGPSVAMSRPRPGDSDRREAFRQRQSAEGSLSGGSGESEGVDIASLEEEHDANDPLDLAVDGSARRTIEASARRISCYRQCFHRLLITTTARRPTTCRSSHQAEVARKGRISRMSFTFSSAARSRRISSTGSTVAGPSRGTSRG